MPDNMMRIHVIGYFRLHACGPIPPLHPLPPRPRFSGEKSVPLQQTTNFNDSGALVVSVLRVLNLHFRFEL